MVAPDMHQNREANTLRKIAVSATKSDCLQQHASLANRLFNKQRIAGCELHPNNGGFERVHFAEAVYRNLCQIVFARFDQVADRTVGDTLQIDARLFHAGVEFHRGSLVVIQKSRWQQAVTRFIDLPVVVERRVCLPIRNDPQAAAVLHVVCYLRRDLAR